MSRRSLLFLVMLLSGLALAQTPAPPPSEDAPAAAPDGPGPRLPVTLPVRLPEMPRPASAPDDEAKKAKETKEAKGGSTEPDAPPEDGEQKAKATPAPAPVPLKKPEELPGYARDSGKGRTLYVVPIEGTIDLGLAPFVERVVERAGANDVILLSVKTFGGRVDGAVRIRDALLDSPAKTVAYVDRRAISAGALISLACETLIMGPGASIGAATPVQQGQGGEMKATSEKVVSYMRAEMRATAEARGRRADLAEAMVDADIEIPGVISGDKLLTLTTQKALDLGLADATAESLEGAITLLNLAGAKRTEMSTHWAEKVARVLTDPVVSSLLMTIGVLGLLMELYTAGFGVTGIIGLSCLALFFVGQYAANLAGLEELLLFVIGIVLLAVEVFLIPGFGITGILGIIALVAALGMALVEFDLPMGVSWELGYVHDAAQNLLIRLVVLIVSVTGATVLLGKYAPRSRFTSWLVFRPQPAEDGTLALGAEAHGGSLRQDYEDLEGQRGRLRTVVRPTGVAEFPGGRRVHVVSEGEFLERGTPVEVIEVDGHRVVVRAIEDAPEPTAATAGEPEPEASDEAPTQRA